MDELETEQRLIKGVIQRGQVIIPKPIDLPDGAEAIVASGPPEDDGAEGWDNSPEGISAWMRWYDSLEPLIFTPGEEADTEAWLRKMNEYSGANMGKGVDD